MSEKEIFEPTTLYKPLPIGLRMRFLFKKKQKMLTADGEITFKFWNGYMYILDFKSNLDQYGKYNEWLKGILEYKPMTEKEKKEFLRVNNPETIRKIKKLYGGEDE